MPNNPVPYKKKLTILASVLLVLASAALFILYNINRNLKLEYIKKLNSADNNQAISDIDKSFFIDLPIDPSTGYLWQADFDSTILKLVSTNFIQRKDSDKTSTEDFQTFEFQALVKSNTSITFNSVRSWEANTAPKDVKVYDVSIR